MTLHLFGIRHHGPGSARALTAALSDLQPDLILVEGPPEGEACLNLINESGMKPPVALLIYPSDQPQNAVFYPYAVFSPEWNALQYARQNSVPVRLIDFPWKNRFVLDRIRQEEIEKYLKRTDSDKRLDRSGHASEQDPRPDILFDEPVSVSNPNASSSKQEETIPLSRLIREDPLAVLAQSAGYEKNESWWEHVIEQSSCESDIFQGILEAMTELRQAVLDEELANENKSADSKAKKEGTVNGESDFESAEKTATFLADPRFDNGYERIREAFMRRFIREAIRSGRERIAVVCGAWHVPVLDVLAKDGPRKKLVPTAKEDDTLLTGLGKIKTVSTWCPWTCSRLSYRSGYGAGIESPGWYDHLWRNRKNPTAHWMTLAARLLREKELDVSAANVIEAVRLAEALAAMRNRPAPDLSEMNDAILSVLCQGNSRPLEMIRLRLEIGTEIGSVPPKTPAVPLQRDIEKEQKRLRLKITEEILDLDLDLRKENDRDKSRLLHRLNLLGIPWGSLRDESIRSTGSFHEFWQIQWQVEFAVRIIEANVWGSTLSAACSGAAVYQLDSINTLSQLTGLLEQALPAEISEDALDQIFIRLQNDAAVSSDIGGLMTAAAPLVKILRYGNVRQTDRLRVEPVFNALFGRILVGLVPSCGALDDDAAETRMAEIDEFQLALQTLNQADALRDWYQTISLLTESDSVNRLINGRCCRILFEQGILSQEDLSVKFGLFVSSAQDPDKTANWLQGFLKGSGQTLIHFEVIWTILNQWLCSLDREVFMRLLPLLRRSFADFSRPELRMMGEKVKRLSVENNGMPDLSCSSKDSSPDWDEKRVGKIIPVLNMILGFNESGSGGLNVSEAPFVKKV